MPFDRELEAALAAAEQASRIILEHYEQRTAMADAPASITTSTDRASQEAILQSLSAQFPDDAFRAEEATPTLERLRREGSRMWIIDPIDGTRGFAKKNGQFSVMIALCVDGVPVVGVVQEPALGRITCAQLGGGCWTSDGEQVRVTQIADPTRCTLTQSHTKPGRGPTIAVQQAPTGSHHRDLLGRHQARASRSRRSRHLCLRIRRDERLGHRGRPNPGDRSGRQGHDERWPAARFRSAGPAANRRAVGDEWGVA